MKITQIVNNNIALVQRGGSEVFVVAKGIGFRKKKGQKIFEHEIEKMYILDSYDMLEHFSYLLIHSDPDDIFLIQKIVAYGEAKLGITATDCLSLRLLDHFGFLLKRAAKAQFIKSPLIWEIKRFYPRYFQVGQQALRLIEDQKDIVLPEDEAVAFALHFISHTEGEAWQQVHVKERQIIDDILSIIQIHFQLILDENAMNYVRFTAHLQYFVQRILNDKIFKNEDHSLALYQQVSQLYPEAFAAVQKIRVYVENQFATTLTVNEEVYLMLHINRLMERTEE